MQLDAKLEQSTLEPNRRHRIWQSPILAILILLTGLGLSFYLASDAARQTRERTQDRFQATVQQTTRVIQEKIDRSSLLMKAGRGLILNNQLLPPAQINDRWHQMFDSFQMDYGELGVVGLSFTRFIAAHERERFVSAFNKQDHRTLKIFPPPGNNQPSLVVLDLVPKTVENRMLGYDLMSEEKRRQAVLEAMRTNQMSLSRPLSLLPTDVNSLDYLQILPVRSLTNSSGEHFLGVVTIGFSMSTLIRTSLEDLTSPLRIRLIDTRHSLEKPVLDTHPDSGATDNLLKLTTILNIGKHSLTLQMSSLDTNINQAFMRRYDAAILISGLSITLMLTLISMFFIITRQQALILSQKMATRTDEIYQRYKALFAQSPEAIVVHTAGQVELANQHAARLFGCNSPEELYHRPITELIHPSSLEFVQRRRAMRIRGQSLEPAEQLLVRANGQPFMAEVSSSLVNYRGQEAVQVVFRDISSEKQQRLEARIANILIEHCQDSIMVTDAKGRIELVNPAFHRLTGYSSKNVTGRTPELLNAGHHSSDFFYQLWSSAKHTGLWRGDIVNRHRNGRLYIQETDIHALRNNDQEITHFVCLMRDVTNQRNGFDELSRQTPDSKTTPMPNRLHFRAMAEKALREARPADDGLTLGILRIRIPDTPPDQHSPTNMDRQDLLARVAEAARPLAQGARIALLSETELALLLNQTSAKLDVEALNQLVYQRWTALTSSPEIQPPFIRLACAHYPADGNDIDTLMLIAKNRSEQA